jgi:hypothetical protein
MPATSETRVHKETAQLTEAVETAAPSKMGRDVPAVRKGRLTTSGMSASAVAAATNEERIEAQRANHQAQLAAKRTIHQAQMTALKQCLPLMTVRLLKLWQCVRGARRSAPTKVHLAATATVEK